MKSASIFRVYKRIKHLIINKILFDFVVIFCIFIGWIYKRDL
nr:MAG TPA: hypothetical protein [Caudoviricetes sp.]